VLTIPVDSVPAPDPPDPLCTPAPEVA
jgi:hypothetical protein